MAGKGGSEIPLSELGGQQLDGLNQQLQQELEFMQNSLQSLKMVQQKFSESQECIDKLTTANKGKDILLPLTSSMYVNGQIDETEDVLVDIGTGYYVQMKTKNAREHFQRKVDYLTKQMEKLQPVLQEKYKMKQAVVEMLQQKVQASMAAQQQQQQNQQIKSS